MPDPLVQRLRDIADRVAETYGSPEPPEDDLSLGDRAYFVMHEAADAIELEAESLVLRLQGALQSELAFLMGVGLTADDESWSKAAQGIAKKIKIIGVSEHE